MSSEPTPADGVSSEQVLVSKPLINPLQSDAQPPSSTIVEPPRTPNPLNPAAGPTEPPTAASTAAPSPSSVQVVTSVEDEKSVNPSGHSLPPLPIDAPVPPSPLAADEPPPTLPPSAIPSAVPTPQAIEIGVLDTPEEQITQPASSSELIPDAFPTPAEVSFDPIAPSITSTPLQATTSENAESNVDPAVSILPTIQVDAMDVDADGEEEHEPISATLKRAGDDMESADVKRVKDDAFGESAPVVNMSQGPTSANISAVDPVNIAVYPWLKYVDPPYRDPGPTSPLTTTQHKYLLGTVRSLLKSNNSFNFREPVDTVRFNIPHYHQIIPVPMDLGTVEIKLVVSDPRGLPKDKTKLARWDPSKGSYQCVADVSKDVRQIWENTRKFNGSDHVVSQAADKLEEQYEKALKSIPLENPPIPVAVTPAGPSSVPVRRPSISQPPTIRREPDSARPKREIHPPPPKDINYDGPGRKPKRRNDPQLQWAARTINSFEKTNKYFEIVSPFLFPVEQIIAAIPAYQEIIKKPIDLLIIKSRLEENAYEDVLQVDADIRLLVSNATTFNPPGDGVYNAAKALLQLWQEKFRSLPPKHEAREQSEEAIVEEFAEESDDEDKDTIRLREAKAERAALDREIADIEARIARKPKRKVPKAAAPKAPKAAPSRKYSNASKPVPGTNGNGVAKKPRKPKESAYREDDESEDEPQSITVTQKQELAEKIQVADAGILEQAIKLIQVATGISGDQEIELDIDSLPQPVIIKLYNLVCQGGRKRGKKGTKPEPRQFGFGGAPGRKHLNEQEEADRIRKMEAQLQSFEGRGGIANAYDEDESSSEEETSDEE